MPDSRLRVMTWNVHSCIGSDGRVDPERIRNVIRAINPDIVALQEVDSRRDQRDGFDLLGDYLVEGRDSHRAEVRTIRTADGDYGHMLVSRHAISAWVCHDVSKPGREPRSLIEARVETGHGEISVLAAHLGLSRRERRVQANKLSELAATDNLPTVILGDFNEPTGFGAATRRLRRSFASTGRRPTYPSRWPLFPLDRIWFESSLQLLGSDVCSEARHASDHLPLWADFALPGR